MSNGRNAFDRAFANRDVFRGHSRVAIGWSLLAGLALVVAILTVGFLIGLLASAGESTLLISQQEWDRFERLSGGNHAPVELALREDVALPAEAADGNVAPPAPEVTRPFRVLTDSATDGLLPLVWRTRNDWWNPALAWAYRHWSVLRSDFYSLLCGLGLLAVSILIRMWAAGEASKACRRAAFGMSANLRRSMHRQATRLGVEDMTGQSLEQVKDLFVRRIDEVQDGVTQWLSRTIRHPIDLAGLVFIVLNVEPWLAFQWLCPLSLCWYLWETASRRVTASRLAVVDRSQKELSLLAEGLGAPRVVRGYGLEARDTEQFEKHLSEYQQSGLLMGRLNDDRLWLGLVIVPASAVIVCLLLFWTTAKVLIQPEDFSLGAMITFLSSLVLMARPVYELLQLSQLRATTSAVADLVFRYLDRMPSVSQAVGAKFLQPLTKVLQWDTVTYRTEAGETLLDRVDLRLPASQTYAIISINPLEARSLVSLLPRFIEPQNGRVLIDGEDIAWATLESLREEVLFVGSDDPPVLGTIRDNIAAGQNFSQQQVTEAAKTARAHGFIANLPDGYETVLDPRERTLDPGQQFRLALARAAIRNPALLIIEEPTVSFDDDTKSLLDDAYNRLTSERTVLFLPSRLSTLRRADQIVVLNRGRIEAVGNYQSLVAQCEAYRHWEYVRFNEFGGRDNPAAT